MSKQKQRATAIVAACACLFASAVGAETCVINLAAPETGNASYSWSGFGTNGAAGGELVLTNAAADYVLYGTRQGSSVMADAQGPRVVAGVDCRVTLSNAVNLDYYACPLQLNGHAVTLALVGANRLMGGGDHSAIGVETNAALTVEGSGSLKAGLTDNCMSATIGSRPGIDAGTILVRSGTLVVNASGSGGSGRTGAAIGSGSGGDVSEIRIEGGDVTAVGGNWAPGIGAGANFQGVAGKGWPGHIVITGGRIAASGGVDGGCGIGGGHPYNGSSTTGCAPNPARIEILGGAVTATAGSTSSGSRGAAAIGASCFAVGADVVIDVSAVVTTKVAAAAINHDVCVGYGPAADGTFAFTNAHDAAYSPVPFFVTTRDDVTNLAGVVNLTSASLAALIGKANGVSGYEYTFNGGASVTRSGAGLWNGGSTNDSFWSSTANWNGDNASYFTNMTFGGTTRLVNTNDLGAVTLRQLAFTNNAGAFVLNGGTIALVGGDYDTKIANYSSCTQTIMNAVTCDGNLLLQDAKCHHLVFGGGLTSPFLRVVDNVDVTFGGRTTISSGGRIDRGSTLTTPSGAITRFGVLNIGTEQSGLTTGGGNIRVDAGGILFASSAIASANSVFDIDGALTMTSFTTAAPYTTTTFRGAGIVMVPVLKPAGGTILAFEGDLRFGIGAGGYMNTGDSRIAVASNATLTVGAITDWTEGCTFSLPIYQPFTLRGAASRLVFDTDKYTVTLTNSVSGNGTVVKTGAGRLTWLNDSPFTGSIVVSNGSFAVGASAPAVSLAVESGATLVVPDANRNCAFASATFKAGAELLIDGYQPGAADYIRRPVLTAAAHEGVPDASYYNLLTGMTTWHCVWNGDTLYLLNKNAFYLRIR